MPFAFHRDDKNAAKAVRRLATERLETSRLLLGDSSLARETLVHELRKNVKKTRALLRLVRPGFRAYGRESAALREAARLISDLRDADVLRANFDRVARESDLAPEAIEALRAKLAPATQTQDDPGRRLRAHAEAIAAVAARIPDWKIEGKDFDALAEGLEDGWDAARKAMRAALAEPTGNALHNWRKRVKDHWHHARLLARIWPEMMAAHITAADTLGETLGDARDLAFLAEALAGDRFAGDADAAHVAERAGEGERRLLKEARALGERFLSEPASGLSRRWRGWWDLWRD